MKDDFYGTFKTHKASEQLLKPKAPSLEVTDPRPKGSGDLLSLGREQLSECMFCGEPLNSSNREYDSCVIGYCNKLHRKDHELQLIAEGRLIFECSYDPKGVFDLPTKDWATGWWENITTTPVYIRDKKHLLEECDKHGVIPKACLKPKHREKGYEARL